MNVMARNCLLALALLGASLGAGAEDIDLFVGVEPEQSTDYPNVLILIDNSANWAAQNQHWPGGIQQGQAELTAIKTVINALAPAGQDAKVNVGLMMLNDATGQTPDGGYVRSALKQMTNDNRKAFSDLVDRIYPNVNDSSEKVAASVGYDRAMFEAFKYFGGYTSPANAYNDTAGTPVDSTHFGPRRYSGNATYSKRDPQAFADSAQTIYNAAAPTTATCKSKNYVILIGNGWPAPTETDAATLLSNVGGDTTQIYETTSSKVRYADEMARFLYQTDVSAAPGKQNVVTYTIDVYHDQQDLDHTKLLQSMAHVGGGGYFAATNADQIVVALDKIFSDIQAVNSVFASVSLPVSVNTQGTYLNQVFVGMFRPDQNARPRWAGNLKQYKLGLDSSSELELQDADNVSAINRLTGFVTGCARSFWTPGPTSVTLPGYWSNVASNAQSAGTCDTYNRMGYTYAEYPDGSVVEKGAQSYRLRRLSGSDARTVKTCPTTGCPGPNTGTTALAGFNNTTVSSPTALGLSSSTNTTDRDLLIDWARGADNTTGSEFFTVSSPRNLKTIRPSAHGDVVHSRPVAINFGDDTNKKVVVFYGGNDGLLRAVNGNRDTGASIGGSDQPGDELWSFMAPEFYTKIQRLRDNTIKINYKDLTLLSGETAAPKPYGVDGPITAYQSGSTSWLYATLRRGGRALYAFDVSSPQSPLLKWRIGCDSSTCSSGFDHLGQTWSSAKPFKTAGYGSGNTPLLVMGGGYDSSCEDFDDGSANHDANYCGDPLGDRVYVLDANSGTRVKKFDTLRSVVGDITLVPDASGLAKYGYAADTGGNVYRITFGSSGTDAWSMVRIASVGCDGPGTCAANRKFLFAPDVVSYGDSYYVLLGSGDREKPLSSYVATSAVNNYFFMIKDRPSDSTWLSSESDNCGGNNLICLSSLLPINGTATPGDAELNNKKGWYLALSDNEQVVTSAITVYGVVTFSTHIPVVYTAGQCSSLGTARVYNINYANAESANGTLLRYEQIAGGGLPPSPVAGMVTLDDGSTKPFVIGSKPDSPLQGGGPLGGADTVQPKANVYWNVEQ